MNTKDRKSIKANVKQYEILADYANSKGIALGEAIEEMNKDLSAFKARELSTISEIAMQFCSEVEALADVSQMPGWLKAAIRMAIRPLIMKAMVKGEDLNLNTIRESWQQPQGSYLIMNKSNME